MELCNSLKKIFLFVIVALFFINLSFAELQKTDNILKVEEGGITTLTFQQSDQIEIVSVSNRNYGSAKPDSFIKIFNETILEADLIASKETSWTFGNDTIKVQEGTRVLYKYGKVEVIAKKGDIIRLDNPYSNEAETISFEKDGKISIQDGFIEGKNLNFSDISIQGIARVRTIGKIRNIIPLDGEVIAIWKSKKLEIRTEESIFLSEEIDLEIKHENNILAGEKELSLGGSNFEVKFLEGNIYATIEPLDHFVVRAKDNCKFMIEDRTDEELIPKAMISGGFEIEQNGKTIFSDKGKIMQKTHWFSNADKQTTPLELLVEENGVVSNKKYLINNARGIAVADINSERGLTDKKYGDSIYHETSSIFLMDNIPTVEAFERITGAKLELEGIDSELLTKRPEVLRRLIDHYNTLSESARENPMKIILTNKLMQTDAAGQYDPITGEIFIDKEYIEDPSKQEYISNIFFHEVAHKEEHLTLADKDSSIIGRIINKNNIYEVRRDMGDHYDFEKISDERSRLQYEMVNKYGNKAGDWWFAHNQISSEEINPEDKIKVIEINAKYWELREKFEEQSEFFESSKLTDEWKEFVKEDMYLGLDEYKIYSKRTALERGVVRNYGLVNIKEDVATFVEIIKTNPGFFKKNKIFERENASVFKDKINILRKYNLISEEEYASILY